MAQEGETVKQKRSRAAWTARTAAQRVRQGRGAKKRVEFSLPGGVVAMMARIASDEDKSMTMLLLEIMQRGDERLGIEPIHFVDLRRRLPAEATDAAIRGLCAAPPG